MTDAELVKHSLAGNTGAFETLITRWSLRVLAYAQGLVTCRSTAEDIAQESFLRAFRNLPRLENPDKFGSWLLSITHRLVLDSRKARRNTIESVDFKSDTGIPTQEWQFRLGESANGFASDAAQRSEQCADLMSHVHALPEELRQVIIIYYFDKVTYAEIATMLGVSKATVNARLTKARALLRERMTEIWSDR